MILQVAVHDGRPHRPLDSAGTRGLTDAIWELMQECWIVQPENRPKMLDVVKNLQDTVRSGARSTEYDAELENESDLWDSIIAAYTGED